MKLLLLRKLLASSNISRMTIYLVGQRLVASRSIPIFEALARDRIKWGSNDQLGQSAPSVIAFLPDGNIRRVRSRKHSKQPSNALLPGDTPY